MIAFIIFISLGLIWLGYETDGLTIRLLVGAPASNKPDALQSKSDSVLTQSNDNVPPAPDVHFKPSEFIPLDMPETTGDIKIVCIKG